MSSPRASSPRILTSDPPTVHPEPLPADLLPQEANPLAPPPDITNPDAPGPQSPSPPSPTPAPERPPQFAPLFALVASSSSSSASPSGGGSGGGSDSSPTNHHPTVHYIFADDHDSDLITAAALQTLDPDPDLPPARPRRVVDEEREKVSAGGGGGGEEGGGTAAAAIAPPERFLIVDLDSTATRVVAARSMARDWQIVNADLTPAPTWEGEESTGNNKTGDGDGGSGGREGRRLMLRVEGVGTRGVREEDVRDGEVEERLEKLAERYERRLGELRRVVEGVGAMEGESKGKRGETGERG
ncbi:hypothetical protein MMC07_002340 [Pseudocyphellaria aurata]|nr:hypothetical protein [Pseudocyphellaria aurata]